MSRYPLSGLIAATFTPMRPDGSLDCSLIEDRVEHLIARGIAGLYVLGSTGEGLSLTHEERCQVAEQFIQAAAGRIPVVVQVGAECLATARGLATHAQEAGASAISAVSPVYFKPDSARTLADSMSWVAAGAPELPFYYYHIPAVTGVAVSALDFLREASQRIPTLRGIKFTSPALQDFQACLEFASGRYDILWGLDEVLLGGLAAGAQGAVGSTYNFAAPIYQRLLEAWNRGDIAAARLEQSRSQALVRTFIKYGPRSAQKAIMAMIGLDCGPPRLPLAALDPPRFESLRQELQEIGFFDWIAV